MLERQELASFKQKDRILLQANEFICLSPHPALQNYISNYNITFPTPSLMPSGFTIMPSGCPTLSIEKSNKMLVVNLIGPTTKPYAADGQEKLLELLVTIEFKPAGVYAFTGIPQNELTDKTITFDMVDPKLYKRIVNLVERASSMFDFVEQIDRLFLEQMENIHSQEVFWTLQTIVNYSGTVSIKELSAATFYSERQLNRVFNQQVGLSPKAFSRLARVNNTFTSIKVPTTSLTLISDTMGYHDLSHFVRDFKRVCGVTPQEFRRNMSDFYINPKKF